MSIMATGRNRNYQIVISLIISLNLLLTWLFLRLGFRVEVIFYVKIAVSLIGLFVRMIFAKNQAEMKMASFLVGSLKPVFFVLLITQPCYYLLHHFYNLGGIWYWLLLTIVMEIIIAVVVYYIGMTRNERLFVNDSVLKILKKK